MEPHWDEDMAKYIITYVGDKFCELVEQEKEAMSWAGEDATLVWKKAVQGVREMCDVCDTTLFNVHWVCHKCGFVVCIDCFRCRTKRGNGACRDCASGQQKWLACSATRQQHEPEKLMVTQIIPNNALWHVGELIHDVRKKWNISSNCPCGKNNVDQAAPKNGLSLQLLSAVSQCLSRRDEKVNGLDHTVNNKWSKKKKANSYSQVSTNMNGTLDNKSLAPQDPLSLLADVASMETLESSSVLSKMKENLDLDNSLFNSKSLSPDCISQLVEHLPDSEKYTGCSTLRELLTKSVNQLKSNQDNCHKGRTLHSTLDNLIQQVVEKNLSKESDITSPMKLLHYIPKNGSSMMFREPARVNTLTESSVLFPDVPHSWLCDGKLLRLFDPRHKGNFKLFQQQWKRGQPVLVSGCERLINKKLWNPRKFCEEFGDIENDLVNCQDGVVIMGHDMKVFWEGFETMSKRLRNEKGSKKPLTLKLKDWPSTEDFADILPDRFIDLMQSLPLPEYTHRHGKVNLASRLPEFFVRPDLGPKLYNAYGSALHPKEGSTNLHLDISDAVNMMMYVGIVKDDTEDHELAALKAIEDAGADEMTKRRIVEGKEIPGALWHIFDARDADKIRDLLNKVAKERGEVIEGHHDPIHDQSFYLDRELQDRLLKEYGVQGYTIVQCRGDAIFIPAGAPHQVRNLHSCIKAAEDFVSPENLSHCFLMTQEFRHLSDSHSNHEDKLQVKNIIYHAVKDACAILNDSAPDD